MSKYIPFPFFHDDVPIDISFIFADEKPAGKHGFLKTDGNHFVFEDGTKVRFWGTNFNGAGCFPEHDRAEVLAKRIAKTGINLVRFHQLDAQWQTPNLFAFSKGKRVTDASFDIESLDRLDYLIHCLKKEGIYCYMDMFTYRKFRSDEGVKNASELPDEAKTYCIFSDKLIELQKDLCQRLWTHKNPYTGLSYADDPVFVMAEIVNESDMYTERHVIKAEPYRTEFLSKFKAWLKDKGIDREVTDADAEEFTDEIVIDFRYDLQVKYYKEMYAWMRECGVKIPITGTNWVTTPANLKSQLVTDFVDNHAYYCTWEWGEFEKRRMNKAITHENDSYLTRLTLNSVADKPMYVSEWDMPWPNDYRAESTLYTAAIGMLQDWSGFAIHTYSYSTKLERMNMLGKEIICEKIGNISYRPGLFSTWNDPAKFGLFYHGALITRRGDVACAKNTVTLKPLNKKEWDYNPARDGIEKSRVVSDVSFESFSKPTDAIECDDVLSDTGEIYRNWKKNYGYINTPKTKCAYGFLAKNGEIELSGVKIDCANDFAVVAMSSLTNEDICHSDNILLTTVGRAENTGSKFEGALLHDIGKPPVLIEVIEADIEIETDVEMLSVWAISPEGYYIGTVLSKYEDGKLKFKVGQQSQSMYYLIVKD